MASIPPAQVTADFAAFQQTTPGEASFAKKLQEQQQKDAKKAEAALKPEQLKMAQKFIDQTKEEDQADKKAALLRKLTAYLKRYPDRLEFVKVPKTVGLKNTVEELKVYVADVEHELGRQGALDNVRTLYVEAMKGIETACEGVNPFGYNFTHLGRVAESGCAIVIDEKGEKHEGRVVPLLEEFSIKHDDWFSTSIEVRLLLMTRQLMLECHRMNTSENGEFMKKAQTTKASAASRAAAKKL